jgi:hypothetical protein
LYSPNQQDGKSGGGRKEDVATLGSIGQAKGDGVAKQGEEQGEEEVQGQ